MIGYVYNDGGRMSKGWIWRPDRLRALAIIRSDKSHDYWRKKWMNAYIRYRDVRKMRQLPPHRRRRLEHRLTNEMYRDAGLALLLQYHHDVKMTLTEMHELYGDCVISTYRHRRRRFLAIKDGMLQDIEDLRMARIFRKENGNKIWYEEERKAFETWIPLPEEHDVHLD